MFCFAAELNPLGFNVALQIEAIIYRCPQIF